jgi:hypothetical protein
MHKGARVHGCTGAGARPDRPLAVAIRLLLLACTRYVHVRCHFTIANLPKCSLPESMAFT